VYLIASVFFGAAVKLKGEVQLDATINVVPGRPADLAGIRNGDRVLRIAGRPVSTFSDASALVGEHGRAGRLEIVVERDAAEVTVMVQPGMDAGKPRIGITPHPHVVNVGIGTAIV
jgi:regulator of sigma E protease